MEKSTKNKTNIEPALVKKEHEITDVLPIKGDDSSDLNKENDRDIVYDLIEDQDAVPDDTSRIAVVEKSLKEQIKQLQQAQKSMTSQLKNALVVSDKLAKHLKKEKQGRQASVTSYVALTIAGLALIIGAAVAFFAGNLQRDVNTLITAVEQLSQPQQTNNKVSSADAKYIHARIDDLAIKIDNGLTGELAVKTPTLLTNPPDKLEKEPLSSTTADEVPIETKTVATKNLETVAKLTPTSKNLPSTKTPLDKTAVLKQPDEALSPAIEKDNNEDKDLQAPIKEVLQTQPSKNKSANKSVNKSKATPSIKKNWVVGIGSYKNLVTATKNAHQYRKAGVPTTILKVNKQGQLWHRLLTKAFSSKQQATIYGEQVKRKLNIESILVIKR